MAAVAGVLTAHATLTSTTVDVVTLSGEPSVVDVINRADADGALLWVTWSTNGSTPTDPVAEADETEVVLPGGFLSLPQAKVIKILGNANPYSVCGRPWPLGGRGCAGSAVQPVA